MPHTQKLNSWEHKQSRPPSANVQTTFELRRWRKWMHENDSKKEHRNSYYQNWVVWAWKVPWCLSAQILTEDVEAEHTGVRGPVDVFALGAVADQLTAVWNVPCGKTTTPPYKHSITRRNRSAIGSECFSGKRRACGQTLTVKDFVVSWVGHDELVVGGPVKMCNIAGMSLRTEIKRFSSGKMTIVAFAMIRVKNNFK